MAYITGIAGPCVAALLTAGLVYVLAAAVTAALLHRSAAREAPGASAPTASPG